MVASLVGGYRPVDPSRPSAPAEGDRRL